MDSFQESLFNTPRSILSRSARQLKGAALGFYRQICICRDATLISRRRVSPSAEAALSEEKFVLILGIIPRTVNLLQTSFHRAPPDGGRDAQDGTENRRIEMREI